MDLSSTVWVIEGEEEINRSLFVFIGLAGIPTYPMGLLAVWFPLSSMRIFSIFLVSVFHQGLLPVGYGASLGSVVAGLMEYMRWTL